jgi:predicted secreted protein
VPLKSEFLINLDANPSTGFAWEVLSIDSSKITFIEKSFIALDSLPGSGGSEQLKFKAIKEDVSPVKLGYLRSWEGRDSMADSFSVFIEVK